LVEERLINERVSTEQPFKFVLFILPTIVKMTPTRFQTSPLIINDVIHNVYRLTVSNKIIVRIDDCLLASVRGWWTCTQIVTVATVLLLCREQYDVS
jgi:hypothetical protein